jgi:nucleoside 2-deoxyribosyltransferase
MGYNIEIFSPFHNIGRGLASEVVHKDIEGINQSKVMLAALDGLDSGTIFEIGYARAKNIPVVIYVENESEEDLKMMEGAGDDVPVGIIEEIEVGVKGLIQKKLNVSN